MTATSTASPSAFGVVVGTAGLQSGMASFQTGGNMHCPRCGLGQQPHHRFCPSCGTRLPTELLQPRRPKVTRWFRSIPVHPEDDLGAVLRVSRYLDEFDIETVEGSVRVPSNHVRFSFWQEDRAICALSIPDEEAEELSEFLAATVAGEQSGEPIATPPAG